MQTLMILPLTMWDSLRNFMETDYAVKMPAFGNLAVILAAMMCAFSVLKVAHDYIQGTTQSNAWEVLRPFVILIMVCSFNTVVLKPFSGMVNVFTREIAAGCGNVDASYWKAMEQNNAKMAGYEKIKINDDYKDALKELEQDTSFLGKFFRKIGIWIKKVLMHFLNATTLTIGTLIGGILFLVAKILLFVQQMLSSLYLTILGILGPVIFAMAILPGFEGGIKSWISRYIQIALWIPIGYLVMAINLKLGASICEASASSASLGAEWLLVANQIVTIVSIAAVPKICGWVIESTGANDAHSALSQPARTASRKLLKF